MTINLKKHWKTIAIGAAVILALVFLARSCRLGDKYSKLKGEYQTYRAISIEDGKRLNALIGAKAAEIEALTRQITDIIAQAGQPSPAEVEKDKAIADLKKKVDALEAQGDLAGALDAAKAEIVQLSEKFTIAEQRHKLNIWELDQAWQAKYNAQVGISDAWKKQYENEAALNAVSQKLIGTLESKVKVLKLKNNVKTLAIVAAGGYLGYRAIKGK
jgi:hypothetical protein